MPTAVLLHWLYSRTLGERIMPVHDWTRVAPEIFHDLYVAWFAELQNVFNNRLLPDDHYALIEQKATPLNRALAIRHVSGHHLVALIEILSPANKDRPSNLD